LELLALKAELQSSLARLGLEPVSSDSSSSSVQDVAPPPAWQAAIAELQQQRADIQRQMEQEAAADAEMESYAEPQEEEEVEEEPQETQRSGSSAVHLGNNESVSETQYSIGGVVTLEPLSSTQRQASSARTGLTFRPAVAASGSTVPEVPLKFAETMLKLEKSVQMRDQLLHHGGVVAHKRRAGMRTREENDGGQRGRRPHRKRSFESGSCNSDSGSDHAVPSRSTDERPDENHRTPTTGSSVTTPTTRSDQKSTASSSKQVRFGDDAYSTPVLARKFNFDGLSIDEDEEEEKEEEESVLSFLGGSSVTSAELNDASFVRAFERFRRELNAPKHNTVTQSPVQQPL
ncbi:hypothetical protein PHYSODRAFT_421157, partial [Phytophthora sojae]